MPALLHRVYHTRSLVLTEIHVTDLLWKRVEGY